jgi:AcrR family transcriptional regulator
MPRQVRTTPRKRPRQARSRETVTAILDATAQVLYRHGFDGLSTNHVATAAGVSIGSLYQYFPNKDALVAAVIERHVEQMHAAIVAELGRVAALPVPGAVRAMVELLIRAHLVAPELHRVLIEQVPRARWIARLRQIERTLHAAVVAALTARRAELAIGDPDLAAFMLVAILEAIVQRALLFQPERLREPALIEEATVLITRYLGVEA